MLVVPYDHAWPNLFELETKCIREALGQLCTAIHHIGSTSVPGLCAKPILDIVAVIEPQADVIQKLEQLGYIYRGELNIPGRLYFSKKSEPHIHLHVYETGHPEIELNLTFRNYLRDHSDAAIEYANLKQKLANQENAFIKNGPFTNYTQGKADFIAKILDDAGFQMLRILHCAHASEWEKAKYFRQKYVFDKALQNDPATCAFNHPGHYHILLYQGAHPIGYAHIQHCLQNNSAVIHVAVVDESAYNQDVDQQFLILLKKWLKSQGIQEIHHPK
jgi:GrpB-like predicted nucleotidyltransferase (UPF0157 family)